MSTTVPELQRQLIFALLRPAARLCARFRVPLKLVEQLCRLAYFEELRARRDTNHSEIAEIFGKSLRTVGSLERQYRGGFLEPQREIALARQIEAELQDGPLESEVLGARLGDVEAMLQQLVAAGRIERDEHGAYRLNWRYISLVEADLEARIGGLNHQLDVIASAVERRFLGDTKTAPAIARTLNFVGTPDEMDALSSALARTARALCGDAEERSLKQGGYRDYALMFALTPTESDDPEVTG